MSEQEDEQEGVEPAPEPQETPLAPGELEAEEEAEQDEQAPEEPAEAPETPEPAGLSEKELEAGRKKLDREAERHRARVTEIMGEEALLLEPCPLCAGFIDGWRFPVVPPPDVIEQVRVAIGMPDLSNFRQAKNARQCDDCAGLGVVLSGSQVPENAAISCQGCNGSGYVVVQHDTGELSAPAPSNGHTIEQPMTGVNPDDPAVKELRARGFTVFPPVQIPGSVAS